MNANVKRWLWHAAAVALTAAVTAVLSGPTLPVAGGAVLTLVVREVIAAVNGDKVTG